MAARLPDISVVIPVFNSEGCIEALIEKLVATLRSMHRTYEIIMVNDASQDSSWQRICDLSRRNGRIRGIDLRKNFGQDNALMAGLNRVRGRFVVIMDDDLQHDPTDIPRLIAPLDDSFDACYGRFEKKHQTGFKNLGSWFNDKVANIILKKPKGIYLSPYKAIRGEVVREMISYTGPYPYIDGLLFRITRSITQVPVAHHPRYSGKGNYTLRKSIRVWSRLATNFSIVPLRMVTILGFLTSLVGFGLAMFYIVRQVLGWATPQGWASQIVIILCLGGIQLISIGIIGEYIGRSFLHNNREPQFVVRRTVDSAVESGPPRANPLQT
jgi:glycosyltransferase involved in cell wall biosynthesis